MQTKTAIHLGVEPNRIDLLTSVKGVDNAVIFAHAERIDVDGVPAAIISFDDLLAIKRSSDRLRDRADAEELLKIRHRD